MNKNVLGVHDEDSYKSDMAKIVLRTTDCLALPIHLADCIIGVLVNEGPQTILFLIFSIESQRCPDIKKHARKSGMGLDFKRVMAVDASAPVVFAEAMCISMGAYFGSCLCLINII